MMTKQVQREEENLIQALERIRVNLVGLNDKMEVLIEIRKQLKQKRCSDQGLFRQILNASNHKIPVPSSPKRKANML